MDFFGRDLDLFLQNGREYKNFQSNLTGGSVNLCFFYAFSKFFHITLVHAAVKKINEKLNKKGRTKKLNSFLQLFSVFSWTTLVVIGAFFDAFTLISRLLFGWGLLCFRAKQLS